MITSLLFYRKKVELGTFLAFKNRISLLSINSFVQINNTKLLDVGDI